MLPQNLDENELTALIEASGLPFATTAMDKAALSEAHPQYIGGYAGKYSAANVVEAVEGSDVLINAGGTLSRRDSPGELTIEGDYTQKAGARLSLRLHGPETTDRDRISLTGAATLAGVLQVQLAPGAQRPSTERLVILTSAQITGRFDDVVTSAEVAAPGACKVEYTDTTVTLVFDRE